jgi:hypothetical protein
MLLKQRLSGYTKVGTTLTKETQKQPRSRSPRSLTEVESILRQARQAPEYANTSLLK